MDTPGNNIKQDTVNNVKKDTTTSANVKKGTTITANAKDTTITTNNVKIKIEPDLSSAKPSSDKKYQKFIINVDDGKSPKEAKITLHGYNAKPEEFEFFNFSSYPYFLFMCLAFGLVTVVMILQFPYNGGISHNNFLTLNVAPKPHPPKVDKVKSAKSKVNSTKASGTQVLVYDGKEHYRTWPDPPPREDLASVARYVMHISEFGSLATNSTHQGIEGFPFVNVFSVSDGPYDNSTGVPYFYFTPLELSVIDLKASNKASLTVTEAQSNYCNKNGFDPEDPRCSHVIFTGLIKEIPKDSEEEKFAQKALFARHVEMSSWPTGHKWFFAKLEILHIYLLDYFGGAEIVNVENYYASNPFEKKKKN